MMRLSIAFASLVVATRAAFRGQSDNEDGRRRTQAVMFMGAGSRTSSIFGGLEQNSEEGGMGEMRAQVGTSSDSETEMMDSGMGMGMEMTTQFQFFRATGGMGMMGMTGMPSGANMNVGGMRGGSMQGMSGENDNTMAMGMNPVLPSLFPRETGSLRDQSGTFDRRQGMMLPPVRTPSPPGQTRAPTPTTSTTCNPVVDICCESSDCAVGQLCISRACITEGNPRITLTWLGNDNLDLTVVTPEGIRIDRLSPLDSSSGGVLESDAVPGVLGSYVENIAFPLVGAPVGEYVVEVSEASRRGVRDTWVVEIYESGILLSSLTGEGSESFVFNRNQGIPDKDTPVPTELGTPPDECNANRGDECCDASDCSVEQLCTQRTCIGEGTPRFTLTWSGGDDLDLSVITPRGVLIDRIRPIDGDSGGVHDGDTSPGGVFDYNVENIRFPLNGGPPGTYIISIDVFASSGVAPDEWTLTVFESGEEIDSVLGQGSAGNFTFDFVP